MSTDGLKISFNFKLLKLISYLSYLRKVDKTFIC